MTKFKFISMGVQYSKFKSVGIPIIDLSIRKPSYIEIGKDVKLNNGGLNNQIGFGSMKCTLIAENGKIVIGNNVGLSQTTLVARNSDILIGENTKLGGGVKVYTTDFHSLNYLNRRDPILDRHTCNCAPITIGADCFIGAGTMILKGVTIGDRVIIGANSVVTSNIPNDVIAAGNPCRVIKLLS